MNTNGKPLLIDAFGGVGGATRGYQEAGFFVVSVDKEPQPNTCADIFIQEDAIEFLRRYGHRAVARHASPPCQDHSAMTKGNRARGWTDDHTDLIPITRTVLREIGGPWVIENVQGSSVRRDLTLCGEMFGLSVIRHRYFEIEGFTVEQPKHIKHRGRVAGMRHGVWYTGPYFAVYGDGGGKGTLQEWRDAMGMQWPQTRKELAEAIPPAYTRYVGERLFKGVTK